MPGSRLAAVLLVAWMLALWPAAGEAEIYADPCRPAVAATIAVVPGAGDRLLVPLDIGNIPTLFELDTGSDLSLLAPAAAAGLRLPVRRAIRPLLSGADGRPLEDYALAPSVRLGPLSHASALMVIPPNWRVVDSRATGMLGMDILRNWDIELDLGDQAVRFYPRGHCLEPILPFRNGADSVPISTMLGHIVVPVRLDGETLRALLDTGASDSSLSLETARRLFGILPGVGGASATITTDGGQLASWSYRFGRLEIGHALFDRPVIDVIAVAPRRHVASDHDMVLGLRELRQMRIFIAFSQNRLSIAR